MSLNKLSFDTKIKKLATEKRDQEGYKRKKCYVHVIRELKG